MDQQAKSISTTLIIRYQHSDCRIEPCVEWFDLWSTACNGQCPSCGQKDVEPLEWKEAFTCFEAARNDTNYY